VAIFLSLTSRRSTLLSQSFLLEAKEFRFKKKHPIVRAQIRPITGIKLGQVTDSFLSIGIYEAGFIILGISNITNV
jgi:hypothetical protein